MLNNTISFDLRKKQQDDIKPEFEKVPIISRENDRGRSRTVIENYTDKTIEAARESSKDRPSI
jgi:hypothetical protein